MKLKINIFNSSYTIIVLVSITVILFKDSIQYDEIVKQINDFCYNMISCNSIISGFIFTGLSVLISILDKERINRLFVHNYLDLLFKKTLFGVFFGILSIVLSFGVIVIKINPELINCFINAILITFLSSIISFIITVYELYGLIKKINPKCDRKADSNEIVG